MLFKKKKILLEYDHRSLFQDSWVKFRGNKLAYYSMLTLIMLFIVSIIMPYVYGWNYDEIDNINTIPVEPSFSKGHIWGTDNNGRDLFIRTLFGVKISMLIGIVASLFSLIIGVLWGSTSGYIGGKFDAVMTRILDILYSLPFMFLVILLMVIFGRNLVLIFFAVGLTGWIPMARIVRGQTISIRNSEYVTAAVSYSQSTWNIIVKHVIPNLLGTIIIYMTLVIPEMILTESFLSFLGLGVQEPMTSLGVLVADGASVMESSPWMFFFPTLLLAIMLFCFNFIGDGLRDAFDPKQR